MSAAPLDRSPAPELVLLVNVGHPGFYPGLTQVRLGREGDFTARRTFAVTAVEAAHARALEVNDERWGMEPGLVRGRLGPARAADLLERAAAFPWDRPFPSRPGIPDEALVVVYLGRSGGPHRTLTLWLREAEGDPVVGTVFRELRATLDELSQGAIFL
ncbi:MAG TPA: hypothetical protein VEW03_06465 [Longimicrobiaceae bacterium]|nr:hypothetical protein [Longimicrobiaceae bacterium]